MDPEVLEGIGLSPNESKVYLTLLEIGSGTAGDISKKGKINRSNVYEVLERLLKKGLVSYILSGRTKYFESARPESLMRYAKEKLNVLEEKMDELKLVSSLNEKGSEAQIFQGVKAFMNINYNWFEYNSPVYIFGIPKDVVDKHLRFNIDQWHKERISKKIEMKHIYNADAKDRVKYLNTLEHTEARCLPERFNSDVETCVVGSEVLLVFWQKPVLMVQIKNEKIASSYKNYFKLLWAHAKAPNSCQYSGKPLL